MAALTLALNGCGNTAATPDAAPDGPRSCTANPDCTAPTAVCDLGATMTCVQCTIADNPCAAATPACVANQCQKCTQHSQCAATSNVCLPEGMCAISDQVAYVQAGGTGASPCAKGAPCGTLDDGVRANKPTVKVAAGTVTDNKTTTIDGKAVTILADPGAKLSRAMQGVILEVRNDNADVRIYDLEITGGTGASNAAISIPNGGTPKLSLTRVTVAGNQGIGISASAGTLTVSQSTISGNTGGGISVSAGTLTVSQSTISGNTGGGISVAGAQFDITNSFIVGNGGTGTGFGGVLFNQTDNGIRRFEFNTVSNNASAPATSTGVVCALITQAVTFSNNIIYDNQIGNGRTQVGGMNCFWTYSDIGPDTGTVPGTNNINLGPMFVNAAQNEFHLMPTSPARDAANPAATINVDFDGDARPQATRSDMGADEIRQ
jgi:Right handed beta helix region